MNIEIFFQDCSAWHARTSDDVCNGPPIANRPYPNQACILEVKPHGALLFVSNFCQVLEYSEQAVETLSYSLQLASILEVAKRFWPKPFSLSFRCRRYVSRESLALFS